MIYAETEETTNSEANSGAQENSSGSEQAETEVAQTHPRV